jgi:hypothetical protein
MLSGRAGWSSCISPHWSMTKYAAEEKEAPKLKELFLPAAEPILPKP